MRVVGGGMTGSPKVVSVAVVDTGTAGLLDVGAVGTGVAANAGPFVANNAYRPATVTAIDCDGRAVARILAKLVVVDLRSAPELALSVFLANQLVGAEWHQVVRQALALLTAVGEPFEREFVVEVNGARGLVVLVDGIAGQGAACSVWVELA